MADDQVHWTDSTQSGEIRQGNNTPSAVQTPDFKDLEDALSSSQPDNHGLAVDSNATELHDPALGYPVVAIGASAGGLQAFRDMLDSLSPETGMSFVLISHLAPNHDSRIVSLLQQHTKMPVLAIEEGQKPRPNQVFVLLPNRLVILKDGVFRLQPRGASEHSPMTVNVFFRSVAEDQKNFAVRVILSGGNGDGAEGLKAIKGGGGFALVQSPESAAQPGMPLSSIAADHVDAVLPPASLAFELGRIAEQFVRPELRLLERGQAPEGEEPAFQRILQLLRNQSGLELRQYKPETIRRRMARRMVLLRIGTLTDYHRFLQGLVVDDRMNVLQSRGQTSPLIQLSPGAVSWNLGRVLRTDIANEVQQAVQRSVSQNMPVSIKLETLEGQKERQHFQIDVLPIANEGPRPRCSLILFQIMEHGAVVRPALGDPAADEETAADLTGRQTRQLLDDLNATRLHLQTLLEERDARTQELVSANEEIQSANEELQSTNEELETTKEELQSTNEELQTVNDELQQRNTALEQTGNDLRNFLNSVNIPLLMLTSDLHIRQFTPPMQRLISVLPGDIGRPISDIRLQLSIENLEPLLREVSDTLVTHESEVQDRDGRWYLLRIQPYRTADNKIEGIVIVLVDIDQLRSTQQGLIQARDFSRSVVESVPVPVVVLDAHCSIQTVNTAFRELTRMRTGELTGRSLPDLLHHLWGFDEIGQRLESLLMAVEGSSITFEHESKTSDKKTCSSEGNACPLTGKEYFCWCWKTSRFAVRQNRYPAIRRKHLRVKSSLPLVSWTARSRSYAV